MISNRTNEFLTLIKRLEEAESVYNHLTGSTGSDNTPMPLDFHPEASLLLFWLNQWRRNYDPKIVDRTLPSWTAFIIGRILFYELGNEP